MTNLDKMFPADQIEYNGVTVGIRPLPLSAFKRVPGLLNKFSRMAASANSELDAMGSLLTDFVDIIETCLDKPLDELPVAMAPRIARAFIRQNLSSDVLGEWQALVGDVQNLVPANLAGTLTQGVNS